MVEVIYKVLAKTGATVRSCGMLYKALAWNLLLCVSGSWVVTGAMLKVLEGFHHRSDRWIAGMTSQRVEGVEW